MLLTARIAAIEFVGICELWNVFLAHGLGVLAEVGVVDRIDSVDSPPPVQAHEVSHK